MATPEMPRDDLVKYLRQLESRLAAVEKKDPFINSGFAVTGPGVVECDNTFNVVGNETVSGTLNVTGNTVIGGTLSLPNGIINNAALTSPLSPLSAHADGTSFSLATGANVDKLVITVPVPSGYTQALVFAGATMNARNSTASTDYAYLGVRINGAISGWAPLGTTSAGTYCMVAAMGSSLLTSLGSSFTIKAAASTSNAAWAADSTNVINLDAIITFLR